MTPREYVEEILEIYRSRLETLKGQYNNPYAKYLLKYMIAVHELSLAYMDAYEKEINNACN